MRRLFDDYMAHGHIVSGVRMEAHEEHRLAPVIVIDNAARCFYDSPSEEWDLHRDFPNVAPPWPTFFMEYRSPQVYNRAGKFVPLEGSRGDLERMGALCRGRRFADHDGWQLAVTLFWGSRRGAPGSPEVIADLRLDETGAVIPNERDGVSWVGPVDIVEGIPREAIDGLEPFIWPFLFALSLLHCKNTTLRQVDPPEKLARAASKRGRPLHRYHVLEVEPMREILERDGDASRSGLKHALHICRGHFKDYRERGLFGRNHGVYWWPQYARGDAERGTVTKDYAVY